MNVPTGTSLSGLGSGGFAFSTQTLWTVGQANAAKTIWSAQLGINIIDAKSDTHINGIDNRYLLQSDGSLYEYSLFGKTQTTPNLVGTVKASTTYESFKKFTVNPLEVLTNFSLYASSDGGANWSPDISGWYGSFSFANDVASDSGVSLFCITSGGLYQRAVTDVAWTKDTAWHQTNPNAIFIDRTRRIFVGVTRQGIFASTDHGATWAHDSAGMGGATVTKINDDAFGNLYAITNTGEVVYRSSNGGQSWTRIDLSIIPVYPEPIAATTFYNVGGDSIVYCASVFGLFISTDQGSTWNEHNAGMLAENIGTIERVPGGRTLTTTDLGVFKEENGDTVWTRTFPSAGYLHLGALYHDGNKNYYLLGQHSSLVSTATRVTYKSIDKGATWATDTAGLSTLRRGGTFYVDEAGVQHQLVVAATATPGAMIYMKPAGGAWTTDTAGFVSTGKTDQPLAMVSNISGQLFLSGLFSGGNIWTRSISGGTWSIDTAGADTAQLYSLQRQPTGTIVGAGRTGHFLEQAAGGKWTRVLRPTGLDSSDAYLASIDSNFSIISAFRTVVSGFQTTYSGTFITRNNGSLWHYTGLQNYSIGNLVSYGDTTYAMVAGRGAFRLTSQFLPVIHLASNDIEYGTVNIGEYLDLPLSISNTGTDSLRITSIAIDDTVFKIQQTTYTIAPGGSVLDTIRFSPNSTTPATGNINIVSNVATSPTLATCSGTGRSSNLQLSTRKIDFGTTRVGRAALQYFTITNHASSVLTITSIVNTQPVFTSSLQAVTIPVGGSVIDTVTFTSIAVTGVNGAIVIASNSPSSPDSIQVSGSGKQPVLSVQSRSVNCGSDTVGKSIKTILSISNRGNDTLNIASINSVNGAFNIVQQLSVIPPNGSAFDTITFTPSVKDTNVGVLVITSDAPTSPDTLNLHGVGLATSAVAEFAPATFYLGEAYPNPTQQISTIPFSLTQDGRIKISVIDPLGRPIAIIQDEQLSSGQHEARIDAAMFPASTIAGIYFVQFSGAGIFAMRKIVVLAR